MVRKAVEHQKVPRSMLNSGESRDPQGAIKANKHDRFQCKCLSSILSVMSLMLLYLF